MADRTKKTVIESHTEYSRSYVRCPGCGNQIPASEEYCRSC